MSPLCACCRQNIDKLNQQVSVMRKEIKNLRQMLDSSVRAHRKHLTSVQAAVSKIGFCEKDEDQTPSSSSPQAALEQGTIRTTPIGYITSCFSAKNGTPRQPTVCGPARARLTIRRSIFNNAEHALLGLDQYSHVWIIFLFHKNGRPSSRAKVKPPRLDGRRVGVYSTRSPHRPNALGLTLARLEGVTGDTLHLSDIDMIEGTPVLDIKPYIPDYDSPDGRTALNSRQHESDSDLPAAAAAVNENTSGLNPDEDSDEWVQFNMENQRAADDDGGDGGRTPLRRDRSEADTRSVLPRDVCGVLDKLRVFVTQEDRRSKDRVPDCSKATPTSIAAERPRYGEEASATIASWIREPPVAGLDVRFTPHAEKQLAEFLPAHLAERRESDRPRFKFLRGPEEAAAAIRGVLSADPRSVYRRTRCRDRLFFFSIDTADVTCWFGQGFVEVLQVRPVGHHTAEDLHK
ncbi:tRNA (adenine(37)-N6)-methyltransferase [Kryptolebias marmoratus]|uniref:tRNA methyltransferase O n=1 Tax=Kryptolebias marmoratus TaxID=37003 RepID=A0A3Q2ZHP0_KRYMA|nr:tRNA (adenine(37)-N6)-methyltransferase [Kryptolebias marmoratus]